MATATLNGHEVTQARVDLPAWGSWWADVTLAKAETLSGVVSLKVADLTLSGAVLSGGTDDGAARAHYRIVAGKGKWSKILPSKAYADDAGVKVSKVLGDAATSAGETLDMTTISSSERVAGWSRPRGPASRVLEQIKPQGWYIGEDGVTRVGARPSTKYTGNAVRIKHDKARGTIELAAESIATLVPGVVVDGVEAVDVQHTISSGGLRSLIWGKQSGTSSRRLEAMRRLILQLLPNLPFYGTWEYRVVLLSGSRLDLQPVRVSTGMPDLQRVAMRPGIAGAKSTLIPGTRVLVTFIDADPQRAQVVGFEDSDGAGFKPLLTEIDATTIIKLADGIRPMAATGDIAGGIWPIVGTTRVMG